MSRFGLASPLTEKITDNVLATRHVSKTLLIGKHSVVMVVRTEYHPLHFSKWHYSEDRSNETQQSAINNLLFSEIIHSN